MTLEELIHGYWQNQPHPQEPRLTVGEFPQAMKMAASLGFGGEHPTPQAAANFMTEFKQMNVALVAQNKMPVGPEEFTHLAQQMARSSFAYHGRPPSMYEIAKMRDAKPADITSYYGSLPDEHYPTVSAADMAKAMAAARPWALQHSGQEPTKLDAAYLHHSGQNPADYYSQRANQDGGNDSSGSHAGVAGAGDGGRQPAAQRAGDSGLAPGNAAAGGPQGVSQG